MVKLSLDIISWLRTAPYCCQYGQQQDPLPPEYNEKTMREIIFDPSWILLQYTYSTGTLHQGCRSRPFWPFRIRHGHNLVQAPHSTSTPAPTPATTWPKDEKLILLLTTTNTTWPKGEKLILVWSAVLPSDRKVRSWYWSDLLPLDLKLRSWYWSDLLPRDLKVKSWHWSDQLPRDLKVIYYHVT